MYCFQSNVQTQIFKYAYVCLHICMYTQGVLYTIIYFFFSIFKTPYIIQITRITLM